MSTFLVFGLWCIIVFIATKIVYDNAPSFKVRIKSISVSLEDEGVTAKWKIGLSVKNSALVSSYVQFRDFNVWVRCTSESSSQAAIPPFKLDHGDKISVNATVKTSLSAQARSQLVHGAVVDVILKARYKVEGEESRTVYLMGKDIGVGFLSDAKPAGFMLEADDYI